MRQKIDRALRFAVLFGLAAALQAGPVLDFVTGLQNEIVLAAGGLGLILCIWSGIQLLTSGGRTMAHISELVLGLFLLLGPNSLINWLHTFVH